MDREKEPCLRRSWIAFLPGGAKRGFSITAIALTELSFLRGGTKRKGREREREKRNTKGTTLPRARIALSRTSWIARKETVLSRRKVLSIHAVSTSVAIKPCPPRDQLFLETLVNEKE